MLNANSSAGLDRDGKVVLDEIYDCADPRPYFQSLGALDYKIPAAAPPVIKRLLSVMRPKRSGKSLKLVDLACSYGVTGRLLRSGLSLSKLYDHYESHSACSRDAMVMHDRKLNSPSVPKIKIVGQDIAQNACAYALQSKAVDATLVANLEEDDLDAKQAKLVADADLIVSTGFIGYGGARTLTQLVDAATDRLPWMAHFVMRPFDYAPIRRALAERGYVTARGTKPLFQRRFASEAERRKLTTRLVAEGIDPTGYEDASGIHAELYISHPAAERGQVDADELHSILNVSA